MVSDVDAGSTYLTGTIGTAANNIVQLDGTAKLPAVDGSQLTGISTGGGKVVARYYAENATYGNTATAIPADDTKPQITEGVEILTVTTGTLSASTNRLRITYGGCFTSNTVGAACAAAVFDGATDALHAVVSYPTSSNSYEYPLNGVYEYAPGATTAKTISIRYGANSSYVMYVNGQSSSRFYGGSSAWTLVVEEIEAS
jgi:hypothetical protein